MTKEIFALLEKYMLSCVDTCAHDSEHIYRVLSHALRIAKSEKGVDYDLLLTACLLHDIGRKEQLEQPSLCHAQVGAKKAYDFLLTEGFSPEFAQKVSDCIRTHRFRKNDPPKSIEAKILFDADKLDVSGATGIARTLLYKGQISEPLYSRTSAGDISDGTNDQQPSFFQEYKYKLEHLSSKFLTRTGAKLARKRQRSAARFYRDLLKETVESNANAASLLHNILA